MAIDFGCHGECPVEITVVLVTLGLAASTYGLYRLIDALRSSP